MAQHASIVTLSTDMIDTSLTVALTLRAWQTKVKFTRRTFRAQQDHSNSTVHPAALSELVCDLPKSAHVIDSNSRFE